MIDRISCWLPVALLALLAGGEALAASPFAGEEHYPLDGSCQSARIVDLDGDGDPDVVAVELGAISVWTNSGGILALARRQPFVTNSNASTIADFNGDGRLDVAFSRRVGPAIGEIGVALQAPDGSWGAATLYPAGSDPSELQVADVNRDGFSDLVVASEMISTYLGRGDGTFGPRLDAGLAWREWVPARSLRLADLDGDARLDAVISPGGRSNIEILRGRGDGTFWNPLGLGPDGAYGGLSLADVDADGWIDIAANLHGVMVVLWNDGGGSLQFADRDTLLHHQIDYPASVLAADFDLDGQVDLLSQEVDNSSSTWVAHRRGIGGRQFETMASLLMATPAYYNRYRPLGAADFDGDGWPDVLSARIMYDWSAADFFLGLTRHATSERFRGPARYPLPHPHGLGGPIYPDGLAGPIHPARLLDNGRLELLQQGPDGLRLWWFDDRGRPAGPESIQAQGTLSGVIDLNGDGRSDVLMSRGADLEVLLSGPGPVMTPTAYWLDAQLSVISDFDGNGTPDLLVRRSNGALGLLVNDGHANFTGIDVQADMAPWPHPTGTGDVDGDGLADLLSYASGYDVDTLLVLPNAGGGTFGPARKYSFENNRSGHGPATVADLDGDGDQDVAALAGGTGTPGSLKVFLQADNGDLVPWASLATREGPDHLIATDFDFDGRVDLACMSFDIGNVRLGVFMNRWPAPFDEEQTEIDEGMAHLVVGDVNGDLRPDLVAHLWHWEHDEHGIAVLLNAGEPIATPALASLVRARFEGGAVRVRWWLTEGHGPLAAERLGVAGWMDLGSPVDAGGGYVEYLDHDVTPGARYAYRLRLGTGPAATYSDVVEVEIPGAALAIRRVSPNPSDGDATIRLAVATTEPVRLELFDVGGRRVHQQLLTDLTPGESSVRLATGRRLPPGVYLLRAAQQTGSTTARVAVIR